MTLLWSDNMMNCLSTIFFPKYFKFSNLPKLPLILFGILEYTRLLENADLYTLGRPQDQFRYEYNELHIRLDEPDKSTLAKHSFTIHHFILFDKTKILIKNSFLQYLLYLEFQQFFSRSIYLSSLTMCNFLFSLN